MGSHKGSSSISNESKKKIINNPRMIPIPSPIDVLKISKDLLQIRSR